jgi:hypothetical protein
MRILRIRKYRPTKKEVKAACEFYKTMMEPLSKPVPEKKPDGKSKPKSRGSN